MKVEENRGKDDKIEVQKRYRGKEIHTDRARKENLERCGRKEKLKRKGSDRGKWRERKKTEGGHRKTEQRKTSKFMLLNWRGCIDCVT